MSSTPQRLPPLLPAPSYEALMRVIHKTAEHPAVVPHLVGFFPKPKVTLY